MRKKVVETCEMCSKETKSPTTIKVEGALLRVCSSCVSFGNVVEERSKKKSKTSASSKSRSSRSSSPSRSKSRSKKSDEEKEILIDNYGSVIKSARMKKKLTQEQLSSRSGVSNAYIRSIESENMRPTDKVARKLEQELGIKLFEKPDAELEHRETSDDEGLTVGDIVTIKRLEYD